ncbi:MAG: hypothetical protein U1E25_14535 [Methylocystis sp.]
MADLVLQRNVGALGALKRLSAAAAATAASTGDSTTTTGATIDRFGFSGGARPDSLALGVAWDATLATDKTLSIGYAVQDSPDGSNWSDYQTATYAAVATGSTAASVAAGMFEASVNLTSARRYVRANFAIDLSATQTDTAVARAVGWFGGFDKLPQ